LAIHFLLPASKNFPKYHEVHQQTVSTACPSENKLEQHLIELSPEVAGERLLVLLANGKLDLF
jgi:hypothetical protein